MDGDLIFLGRWKLKVSDLVAYGPFNLYQKGEGIIFQHPGKLEYANTITFEFGSETPDHAFRFRILEDQSGVRFQTLDLADTSYLVHPGPLFVVPHPQTMSQAIFHRIVELPGLKEIQTDKKAVGRDFSHVQFNGADFSGVDLTGSIFSSAQLDRAIFKGAKLSGVQMSNLNCPRLPSTIKLSRPEPPKS